MADAAQRQRLNWRPILPVPDGTPSPRFTHPVRGAPIRVFEYRDVEQQLLGFVCRFPRSAGGVHEMTLTWCANQGDESHAWRWIQFPKLRPLYGAERLDPERRRLAVVLAEELEVEELRRQPEFEAYDFVSWPGGRAKLGEVDWSPLKARIAVIWLPHSAERFRVAKGDPQSGALVPIEKQPWRVAAHRMQETLREFGSIPICVIEAETTEELADGWDPVRALSEGWSAKRLFEWFQNHFGTQSEAAAAAQLAASPTQASGNVGGWMRTLIRKDGTGPLLAELHNVRLILTHHDAWRDVIYLDDFAHAVRKGKAPPFDGGRIGEWLDTDDSMGADWLASQCGILKLRTPLVGEAVQTVAALRARNPVLEHLKALKWDKQPRLDTWLRKYLNAGPFAEDMTEADIARLDEYLRIVGRKWLLGAVARVLRPGCKFDYVLILEGQQGLGKSSALALIGGEWTMDTPFALGNKEGMETIRGVWIVEVAELDAFNKAESTMAKSFFSRGKDRFRLPYGRRSAEFLRSCVFAGTTNEDEYFRDPTGNRRYWPVHCDRRGYDRAALERDRDQLLAEAYAAVGAGEQIWPSRSEEVVVREQQRKREVMDPWISIIAGWLRSPDAELAHITRDRILREALKIDAARIDERAMATRVGKAMHKLGYVKVEDKGLPERFRYEKRPGHEQDDA